MNNTYTSVVFVRTTQRII